MHSVAVVASDTHVRVLCRQSATDGATGTEQEAGKKPGRVVSRIYLFIFIDF